MEVANFDVGDFKHANEADKTLLVKFMYKPRQDKSATKKEGRPIFKDAEYIDIKIPGDRNGGVCRPATDDDKRRFPEHYRRFKERSEAEESGTPLSEWPQVTRSLVEELAFFHVKTVEQLASMADVQASKFRGLMGIREKARQWLKRAEDDKPMLEMEMRLRSQDAEIAELRKQIGELAKIAEGLDEPEDGENERQTARRRTRAIEAAKKVS